MHADLYSNITEKLDHHPEKRRERDTPTSLEIRLYEVIPVNIVVL